MSTRTRLLLLGTVVALSITGGVVATQATAGPPSRLIFDSHLTAIEFFSDTGPIAGFPSAPLVPGDRIIGQDEIRQSGRTVGHDNEACTVAFNRDVNCQDIVIFDGRGDLQASWTFQWPESGNGGPTSFDGVIDGGTSQFQSAHGSFHAMQLSDGDLEITGELDR